ncbi:MAG: 30S ribosomal protein S9 [Bdellovibrionales bacterium]|nr:30S ribosomal protein S9 [Bdellovibrionales bacterium]
MIKKDYFYGTGRRKTSSARVFLKKGTGLFKIKSYKKSKNKKTWIDLKDYFVKEEQWKSALSPLEVLKLTKSFNVLATVKGGGFTGQAGALRHGLSRALLNVDSQNRTLLKKNGFLSRDSRMVERKKYGRHKARKSTQFSKR